MSDPTCGSNDCSPVKTRGSHVRTNEPRGIKEVAAKALHT
jgi:hypothetical protein